MTTPNHDLIGRTGLITFAEVLQVQVHIVDTVYQFGREDLIITPVAGYGMLRVHAARVRLDPVAP